jgi:prolipoprotein diacylglyceryl transferase
MLLSYITWNADPTAFTIPFWGREIRWYAFAFVIGFALGLWIVKKIWKNENLNPEWYDSLFLYVVIATVVGSRLGHVLFYNPGYYFSHPIEILKTWEGGLASHGGTLGIIIAVWIFSRIVTHKSMLWTFDRLVVPVGFVAALIRIGNLMNSEIYGGATTLPWGFKFVRDLGNRIGSDPFYDWTTTAVHPTQIYEAFCDTLTGFICLWMYWKRKDYKYEGLIFGVFLIGIFLSRFFVEFLKNNQEAFEDGMLLNMGQLLSIPFIIAGVWLMWQGLRKRQIEKVKK